MNEVQTPRRSQVSVSTVGWGEAEVLADIGSGGMGFFEKQLNDEVELISAPISLLCPPTPLIPRALLAVAQNFCEGRS